MKGTLFDTVFSLYGFFAIALLSWKRKTRSMTGVRKDVDNHDLLNDIDIGLMRDCVQAVCDEMILIAW